MAPAARGSSRPVCHAPHLHVWPGTGAGSWNSGHTCHSPYVRHQLVLAGPPKAMQVELGGGAGSTALLAGFLGQGWPRPGLEALPPPQVPGRICTHTHPRHHEH